MAGAAPVTDLAAPVHAPVDQRPSPAVPRFISTPAPAPVDQRPSPSMPRFISAPTPAPVDPRPSPCEPLSASGPVGAPGEPSSSTVEPSPSSRTASDLEPESHVVESHRARPPRTCGRPARYQQVSGSPPSRMCSAEVTPVKISAMPLCEYCGASFNQNHKLSRHLLVDHRMIWMGNGSRSATDEEYEARLVVLRRSQMNGRRRRRSCAAEQGRQSAAIAASFDALEGAIGGVTLENSLSEGAAARGWSVAEVARRPWIRTASWDTGGGLWR